MEGVVASKHSNSLVGAAATVKVSVASSTALPVVAAWLAGPGYLPGQFRERYLCKANNSKSESSEGVIRGIWRTGACAGQAPSQWTTAQLPLRCLQVLRLTDRQTRPICTSSCNECPTSKTACSKSPPLRVQQQAVEHFSRPQKAWGHGT